MAARPPKTVATYSTSGYPAPSDDRGHVAVIHSQIAPDASNGALGDGSIDRRRLERAPGETIAQSLARARQRTQLRSPKLSNAHSIAAMLLGVSVPAVLGYAWLNRGEGHIDPSEGIGYALGIIGSVMMLSLLLYPLRKYSRRLQGVASVQAWFNAHIVLGLIGPTLVVLHTNFSYASTNAAFALVVMLAVVASGLVGRYIYARTIFGLSGKAIELQELLDDAAAMRLAFGGEMQHAPEIEAELSAYEDLAKAYRGTMLGSLQAAVLLGPRSRRSHALVRRLAGEIVSARALREHWVAELHQQRLEAAYEHFDLYFSTVRWAASLQFFERLFRLWHVLHMPLFLLLITAAVVHVIAVHLY